jgi:DNA-binding MarR family transcriptional regulator
MLEDRHPSSDYLEALYEVIEEDLPPVQAELARWMDVSRASVSEHIKRLVADGLLELAANTDHRRSRLVCLTEAGRAAYSALEVRQASWVNRIADGIRRTELETTTRVLDEICRRLETGESESAA